MPPHPLSTPSPTCARAPDAATPLPADAAPAHTLRLLLGDQLNPDHAWFGRVDAGVVYVLLELRQETDYVRHHAQKILAIFAAMRRLAQHLAAQGHRVRYVGIDALLGTGSAAGPAAQPQPQPQPGSGTGVQAWCLSDCLSRNTLKKPIFHDFRLCTQLASSARFSLVRRFGITALKKRQATDRVAWCCQAGLSEATSCMPMALAFWARLCKTRWR